MKMYWVLFEYIHPSDRTARHIEFCKGAVLTASDKLTLAIPEPLQTKKIQPAHLRPLLSCMPPRRSLCLWSSQVLRNGQEVGNDRAALLHPFERLVQLLNAAGRVHDELLLGRQARCVGCREWVGADARLSEYVGEDVYRLIERRQVHWGETFR